MRTFEGFINQGIDDLMQEISAFLRIRGGGADKDHFLADIDKWKLRGENIYMSKEDETAIIDRIDESDSTLFLRFKENKLWWISSDLVEPTNSSFN